MRKILIKLGTKVFIICVFFSFTFCCRHSNQPVLNNVCYCDSLIEINYNEFQFDQDSNLLFTVNKTPFLYTFLINNASVLFEGKNYHKLIIGEEEGKLEGYLRITDSSYQYIEAFGKPEEVLLNFNVKHNDTWEIKNGFFQNYTIKLQDKVSDKQSNDTVFVFRLHYKEAKSSHGFYYDYFFVSKKYGILQIIFTNGIKCYTEIGLDKKGFETNK